MYNFKVKSSVHNYEVDFVDDIEVALNEVLMDTDVVLLDKNIKELYGDLFNVITKTSKIIEIEAIEANKSYQGIEIIIDQLIQNGFRKNHRLIAIGGGIIQDITAFISSLIYRGVHWVLFPTTLLAQGDSCIGSKSSVNFGEFKNQLGGFYPPNKILISVDFLDTLSAPELMSGLGEMLHYFVISGEDDFKYFKKECMRALTDKTTLVDIIVRSLSIKRKLIEIDEFDQKERQIFNYGHTFGHAIETLTDYRTPHGIAVARGIDFANFISMKLGYITPTVRNDIRQIAEQIWAGSTLGDIKVDSFNNALKKDKKNVDNNIGLILTKGYGKVFKELRPFDEKLNSWIEDYFSNQL